MNKAELIAAMAAKTGETKKAAEASVNAFVEVVTESLKKGEKVQLVGFGSFEVRKRAARKGRNPQTKEEIKIPASKAPVIKAGKALKELVNKMIKSKEFSHPFSGEQLTEKEFYDAVIPYFVVTQFFLDHKNDKI